MIGNMLCHHETHDRQFVRSRMAPEGIDMVTHGKINSPVLVFLLLTVVLFF